MYANANPPLVLSDPEASIFLCIFHFLHLLQTLSSFCLIFSFTLHSFVPYRHSFNHQCTHSHKKDQSPSGIFFISKRNALKAFFPALLLSVLIDKFWLVYLSAVNFRHFLPAVNSTTILVVPGFRRLRHQALK